jgi:hypothetical protein
MSTPWVLERIPQSIRRLPRDGGIDVCDKGRFDNWFFGKKSRVLSLEIIENASVS